MHRTLRPTASAIAVLLALAGPSAAELISEDSDFGVGTITLDTSTGLRWLDVPLTTGHTYDEIVTFFQPGGELEGYRLATQDEVEELFVNAGIDISTTEWVPQNHDPNAALAALVGQTGSNGNCGAGCTFNYTQGWVYSGDPPPVDDKRIGVLQWFDNTAGLNPTLPQAPIGRSLPRSGTVSPYSGGRGAWLVQVPEPAGAALASAVALALLARGRSARPDPRRAQHG
jgi:hypothetical protein